MNKFVKWIKDHAVTLICLVLMAGLLYGMFMFIMNVGNYTTVRDSYDYFFRHIEDKLGAVAVISEYEISQRDPADTGNRTIPAQGEYPDLREIVFGGDTVPISAETYSNTDSGKCGAMFTYDVEGVQYQVIYEKGIKQESELPGNDPGTEHFEYFGEDIKIIKAVPDR